MKTFKLNTLILSLLSSLFIMGTSQAVNLYLGTCTTTGAGAPNISIEWCWGDDDTHTFYTPSAIGTLYETNPATHNIVNAEYSNSNKTRSIVYRAGTWTLRGFEPGSSVSGYTGICQVTQTITTATSHTECINQLRGQAGG